MSGFVVFALVLSLSAMVPCLGFPPSVSAAPQPCLAPLQWEGRTVEYDHGTGRNTRAAVSYDAQNQRIRVLEQKTDTHHYIYLFKSGVLFQIEEITKQCAKIALTEDQYFIGGPGDMIEVQEWSDRKPARKNEAWVGVYTLKDCYPVQETYTKNSSVTTSTRFFDLQVGISDPGVFDPPSTFANQL
uniref:Mammalian ependymin-related protein 1 n=1 Tax=Sinocyclocheilus anshuiensis TaxID=1608454 RepID=A0A671L3J3_9TELE